MMPALIRTLMGSKKELLFASICTFSIACMPIVVLISITNLSVFALPFDGSANTLPVDVSLYDGPSYPGDLYDFGNCTFWVAMRRAETGKSIPNTWGNAATWAVRAQLDGYIVDHTPTLYAIMQTPYVDNGLGHVAFVERVQANGEWYISEMNVVGFDEVDYKTMSAAAASDYNFIHSRE